MSITIPLLFNPNTEISQLGGEFQKLQRLERDRGLLDPTIRSTYSNLNTTDTINLAGVDMNTVLENNQNPSEELYQTDLQAKIFLSQNMEGDRPLTQQEKEIELFVDADLDPRIRQELMREAAREGSNIFSLESQDFVKTIQEDIAGYYKEANLYYSGVPFTQSREGLLRQFEPRLGTEAEDRAEASLASQVAGGIINEVLDQEEKRKKERAEAKKRRERFTKTKAPKTTEERMADKGAGRAERAFGGTKRRRFKKQEL